MSSIQRKDVFMSDKRYDKIEEGIRKSYPNSCILWIEEIINPELEDGLANDIIQEHIEYGKSLYDRLIKVGVARECARMVLPLNVQTTLYMKGNIRSWIHYLQLRTKEDTQKEHRLIAEEINKIFINEFPVISNAILEV
jgi:flavin-dependent thymidylate synthase